MQVLDESATRTATPWPALIGALRAAFAADHGGAGATAPPRAHHAMPVAGRAERTLLSMPAWDEHGRVVVKLVNVVPDAGARGLPAVQGTVMVADGETGAWTLAIDGGELTARRTAAASALAADYLARADAETLAVVGSGRLCLNLIAAHSAVRPIRRAIIWARDPARAAAAARAAEAQGFNAEPAGPGEAGLAAAVGGADVISCATLSETPLVRGLWLPEGAHLDLVGAFKRTMRETDAAAVARAEVFVDTRAGAEGEAGDLHWARDEGAFDFADIRADLAQLCAGAHPGRGRAEDVTLFKSVGASLEDFAAASLIADGLAKGGPNA